MSTDVSHSSTGALAENPTGQSAELWQALPTVDPHCFACGAHNDQGLHMTFATNGKQIRSQVVIPEHVRGWSNLAHGGVTTTILDETMAWACIYFLHQFPLTRDIQVRFKKPVYVGDQLYAITTLESLDERRRKLIIQGQLFNQKDELVATATGDFAPFTPEQFATMDLVPQADLDQLTAMFSGAAPGMPE